MTKTLKRLAGLAIFGLLLMSGAALAHPNHKVMGTVMKVTTEHVIVKDRAGKEHTIKLAKTTKVTKNKKAMKAADVAVGTRVVATVISDTDLTAKIIEVGVAPAATK
ncbi:MAG: hypothetical protein WD690_14080 [Vicinamibacterales bacterium]